MSKIWHRLIEYWSKYLLPPDIWWQNYVMGKKITKKTTTKLTHLRPCCHLGLCLNQFSVIAPDAEMTVVMTGQRRNLGLRETLGPALWHKYHQNKVKTLASLPLSPRQGQAPDLRDCRCYPSDAASSFRLLFRNKWELCWYCQLEQVLRLHQVYRQLYQVLNKPPSLLVKAFVIILNPVSWWIKFAVSGVKSCKLLCNGSSAS